VQRAANRVLITDLIDAVSGVHPPTERYNWATGEVFALQEAITQCLVAGHGCRR
jgi:TolB-like protein